MPMTVRESNRPYAYPGNIMDVLNRYRQLDLPSEFEPTDLSTAGVPEGNHGRTLFALKHLNLLTEANTPTPEWRALCDADDEEFKSQLAALVRAAYSDVFARVNPETDNQERVKQAFQPYTPKSQIDRMVAFFLGMCREAGIPSLDAPKRRPTKVRGQAAAKFPSLTAKASGQVNRNGKANPRTKRGVDDSLLFGVSDQDIALLDDAEFQEVWAALGKVARARARKVESAATEDADSNDA